MNRVLRVGDTSVRVAEARATLARLGLLSDFKGELSAWKKQKYSESDKSFDANLSEVLKAFQQSRGIVPTGEIDDLTLRELRQASYTLGGRVLSYEPANELVGDDISQLQQQLQETSRAAPRYSRSKSARPVAQAVALAVLMTSSSARLPTPSL